VASNFVIFISMESWFEFTEQPAPAAYAPARLLRVDNAVLSAMVDKDGREFRARSHGGAGGGASDTPRSGVFSSKINSLVYCRQVAKRPQVPRREPASRPPMRPPGRH